MGEYSTLLWFMRLLRLVKITGFSTFSVENGEVVIKFNDILCFSVSFSLGILISANSLLTLDINLSSNDFIVVVGNQVATNSAILIAITSMLLSLIFRRRIYKVIMLLHGSDLKVFQQIFSKLHDFSNDFIFSSVKWVSMSITITLFICSSCYHLEAFYLFCL